MSELFDPEKIERPYVKEWGHHAVYVNDYDRLLAANRDLQHANDVLTRTVAATIERASTAEAANREKDAQLDLLRQNHPFGAMYDKIQKLQAELSSLRASVGGEKWIEIKPDTMLTDQMEVGRWIRKDKWTITRLEGSPCEGWQYIAPNDFFTHYRMLAPPTLPGEEK